LKEYLTAFVNENPEFLPARIAGGTGMTATFKAPAAGRVLGQVAAIRGELLEMDVSELPTDQHAELCSRALPYAVVLGGSERWIDALVATDTTPDEADEGFTWYRGPSGWHLHYLPDSLRNLTTNLTGALFAR